MLIICEPQCVGFEHAEFNAALVAAFREGFPSERVLFLAEKEHGGIVGDKLAAHGVSGVEVEALAVPPRNCPARRRYPLEFALMRGIFARAADMGAAQLVFSSITAPGLMAVKLNLALRRNMRCVVVSHGILEEAVRRPLREVLRRPLMFRYALAAADSGRLRYLVLGEPLRDELLRHLPRLRESVWAIEHPYFFRDAAVPSPCGTGPVRFGFLGVGAVNKGILNMSAVSAAVRSERGEGGVEFLLVGHPENAAIGASLDAAGVKMTSRDLPLARDAYESALASLHYALFPCDAGSYALRASGTFLDALSGGIPIVAVRTPFFSHYFERMGDIGYLCDGIEELKELVLSLAAGQQFDRHDRQRNAIVAGRELFSPASVGKSLAQLQRRWRC